MAAIAYVPTAPPRNPPRTSYSSLGGRTVRLEAPDELAGRWEGPVYATIGRAPSLRETAASPFFDDADGLKRPAWQATLTFLWPGQRRSDVDSALQEHVDVEYWIPHWRLTEPSRDLSDELLERPLLSVFRFLRFSQFFVASTDCDTKFIRHTSEVYLCGQVLSYVRASTIVLVDDIDLVLDPGCSYLCQVAVRGPADESRQVVAVPLNDMRSHAISREEFMLGFGHGSRVTSSLPNFTAAWQSFQASPPVGPADVRSVLTRLFPAPGATGGVLVDIGGRAISYVTPRGAKTSAIPAAFAWQCVATTPYDDTAPVDLDRLHESSDDIGLPLLTLEDTISTPCDLFSTIRAAGLPPTPAAGAAPRAPQRDIDQSAAHTFLQRLLQEQRDANASFRSQMETMSATLAALQQRVTQPSPLPLPQEQAGHTNPTGTRGLAPQGVAEQPMDRPEWPRHVGDEPPRSPEGYLHAHGQVVPVLRERSRGRSQSSTPRRQRHVRSPRQAHRSRTSRQARRSRSPRRAHRSRSPHPTLRFRSGSPRSQLGRSRSRSRQRSERSHLRFGARHRRSRPRHHRSHSRHRSRSRGRSFSPESLAQGHLPIGNSLFRPSTSEVAVHRTARVGPRPPFRSAGTDELFLRFINMPWHDRVCSIHRQECFRGRYRVTKVTAKMLFSVDFFSRPFDHFLSSEDPGGYRQDRTVVHEDSQWGGSEPAPAFTIRRADQLHQVLHVLQEAAMEWYPSDVAAVFRTVHGDAVQNVPLAAPKELLNAMCNLYQAIFSNLYDDLLHDVDPRDLNGHALRELRQDSPSYQRFVTRVLNAAVVQSVFPGSPISAPRRRQVRGTSRPDRSRQTARSSGPTSRRPDTSSTIIPAGIRTQIPVVNGKQVCIRYQSAKGCTFPRCSHLHELHELPPDVVEWVIGMHTGLKAAHPQRV